MSKKINTKFLYFVLIHNWPIYLSWIIAFGLQTVFFTHRISVNNLIVLGLKLLSNKSMYSALIISIQSVPLVFSRSGTVQFSQLVFSWVMKFVCSLSYELAQVFFLCFTTFSPDQLCSQIAKSAEGFQLDLKSGVVLNCETLPAIGSFLIRVQGCLDLRNWRPHM